MLNDNQKQKINLIHVVDSFMPGGKERLAVEYINRLDNLSYNKTIISTRCGGPLIKHINTSVRIKIFYRNLKIDIINTLIFGYWLYRNKPDIIHTHGFYVTLYIIILSNMFRLNSMIVMHGHDPNLCWYKNLKTIKKVIYRRMFSRNITGFVGVDKENVEWAKEILRIKNTQLIKNGVSIHLGCCTLNNHKIPKFVFVGNFREQKGHTTLIDALKLSSNPSFWDITFFTGSQAYESTYGLSIRKQIEILPIKYNIYLDKTNIEELIKEYDIGLMLSKYESGPLVLAEYMAAGLTYIATDVGEITKRAHRSSTGLIIPPLNSIELVIALNKFINMSVYERQYLQKRSFEFAKSQFNINSSVTQLHIFYQHLMQGEKS